MKVINTVGQFAKLPYFYSKGSEKQRMKMAANMSEKFFKELDNHSGGNCCLVNDFCKSLNKVLEPYKIMYTVEKEASRVNNASLAPIAVPKVLGDGSLNIDYAGFKFLFPLNKGGDKITNKYPVFHEVRHFFDHISNPKLSQLRLNSIANNMALESRYDNLKNLFADDLLKPVDMKNFKSEVNAILAELPDDVAVDSLQKIRNRLKTEINAYGDELKFRARGIGIVKYFYDIVNLKMFLCTNAKFKTKLRFANKLLKERLEHVRKDS